MKIQVFSCLLALTIFVTRGLSAEKFDDAVTRATTEYTERLRTASEELSKVREQIAIEKAPLLKALRAAEERIVAAEASITRLETNQEQSSETRRVLLRDHEGLKKNLGYMATLAHDSITALQNSFAPGEEQLFHDRLQTLQQQFESPASALTGAATVKSVELLMQRFENTLGGSTLAGKAIRTGDTKVIEGTFAFVGPETYFRARSEQVAGVVRLRDDSLYPIYYPLHEWKSVEAEAFFQGKTGSIMVDTSGGKALRLQETKGTLWQHVNKGGVVSYAILVAGFLALLLILGKVRDLWSLEVDEPHNVHQFLGKLSDAPLDEVKQSADTLRTATRELFTTGIRHLTQPKTILEDHMWAVLLRLRLHYERRLPLLSVIAVASPLMGLLGTVTGMVKTFALITVFGTGNAGKLASGISEVLVSTELGLIVAIPALIAHGFLANRIQKKLSLLERYTLEFVTAAQCRAAGSQPEMATKTSVVVS